MNEINVKEVNRKAQLILDFADWAFQSVMTKEQFIKGLSDFIEDFNNSKEYRP